MGFFDGRRCIAIQHTEVLYLLKTSQLSNPSFLLHALHDGNVDRGVTAELVQVLGHVPLFSPGEEHLGIRDGDSNQLSA